MKRLIWFCHCQQRKTEVNAADYRMIRKKHAKWCDGFMAIWPVHHKHQDNKPSWYPKQTRLSAHSTLS